MNTAVSCDGCENFDHLCLRCRTRRFDLITKHMNPARREVALQREQLILMEFPEEVNLVDEDDTDDDQATINLTEEEEELYWEEAEAQELADADAELDDSDSDDDVKEEEPEEMEVQILGNDGQV